ncbi:unnamed protein product [Blepharisma stoltei]|uniref:Aminopeptidase n=1 Tax=Blepharisma stoltei TaxID=1481888 RepID=A0AAU9KMK1_9CILI|nr:unnamed protein product [Blepharisma stoltei]
MSDIRLPQHVKPTYYAISLEYFMREQYYTGTETVTILIETPSKIIYMHSDSPLVITDIAIVYPMKSGLSYFPTNNDKMCIELPTEIEGEIKIKIDFEVKMDFMVKGSYVCSSTNRTLMATTHFEPIYARKAFPCFDEPIMKARFQLNVTADDDFFVISNMNYTEKKTLGSKTAYKFEETPLMPCYLLHWTVCKHNQISIVADCGVKISLYAENTDFSHDFLELAKSSLDFYNNYFGIPYPLQKLDLISVFKLKSRAMENWGSITFADYCIERLPNEDLQLFPRNCRTLCHEISHMWFGNLVTMEWWTHLWLNEGFARFIEYKCLNILKPRFKIWLKFLIDVWNFAMVYDVQKNTHSIEVECDDPNRIEEIFDAISYAKGASVLRMLEDFIGEEQFLNGIRKYLNVYKWKNTTTDMLWEVLAEFSFPELGEIMQCWTRQAGFPLITVKKIDDLEYKLTQYSSLAQNSPLLWHVPIKFIADDLSVHYVLFKDKSANIKLEKPSKWIKLNFKTMGFYRSIYSDDVFYEIIKSIKLLSAEDRYGLLDDCIQFYMSTKSRFACLADLIVSMIPEYEYIIVKYTSEVTTLLWENEYLKQISHKLSEFFTRIYRPFWDEYKLDKVDDYYDFGSARLICYKNLVEKCKDREVAWNLIEAKDNGSLSTELEPCYFYSKLLCASNEELYNLSLENINFACFIMKNSEDSELIKYVLHFYRLFDTPEALKIKEILYDSKESLNSTFLLSAMIKEIQIAQETFYINTLASSIKHFITNYWRFDGIFIKQELEDASDDLCETKPVISNFLYSMAESVEITAKFSSNAAYNEILLYFAN